MDSDDLDFESDVEIDRANLETEWENQPELALQYSQAESQAQKNVDDLKVEAEEAKEEVNRAKYDVYLDAIDHPKEYKISKTTDKVLEAVANNADEVVEARAEWHKKQRELNEALHQLNQIHGACNAITTDRRQALAHEVSLWSQGYFGTPSSNVSGDEEQKVEKRIASEKMQQKSEKKQQTDK